MEKLNDKRRYLRTKTDSKSRDELELIDSELAEKYAETNYRKINEELKAFKGEDGGFNPRLRWKLKKKLSPKQSEPPTAMKDADGNLLTDDKDIVEESVKHYKKVFEDKAIDDNLKDHKKERQELCAKRLELAAKNKTPPWTIKDVKNATQNIKSGISKDPYGHPNELFKDGVAGDGLMQAIKELMNRLKDNPGEYSASMDICNVTSLYKNKGDKNMFDSHRGVFRTTILRNILERLIYNDEYNTVDSGLTDCNVGCRKKRNVRHILFVINAVTNSSKKGTDNPCDICVYQVRKCFDTLWMSECINDLYESGLTNDKLCLLFHANKSARIAIKSSSGVSERFTIHNKVMQGTVWAGLM